MKRIWFGRVLVVGMLLSMGVREAASQPGCIAGDRIHRNVRIADNGNACNHCTNNPPDVLLHLLHSHQPTIKLTHNLATGNCFTAVDGTLSLHYDGASYSSLETPNDYALSLVAGPTAGNLILSTRNDAAAILFATAPATPGNDLERMRITAEGHVGIWQDEPRELLHIGKKMTFHIGFENNYLGYNVYRDGNDDRLLVGLPDSAYGYATKYGMTRQGVLELGVGSTADGEEGDVVDWYEGGSPFSGFAGLTLTEYDGRGCASFGRYWPDAKTRVLIRGFAEDPSCSTNCATTALSVLSSSNASLLRVRNGGNVGIGQSEPKERLHVGELIAFHDGGAKFIGYNAVWDASTSTFQNLAANRASVTMGIGDAGAAPHRFTFSIDKNSSTGQVFDPTASFSVFKGWSMDTDGKMGVGTLTPSTMLHIAGDVTVGTQRNTRSTGVVSGARLTVDGVIFSKQVIVSMSDWADHVFDDDYQLMPLEELRAYIGEHGHLPDIPTTTEVMAEGVSVGDIQVKLLEKVEQLTLYVLDLSARNEELRREVEQLREARR